MLEMRLNSLPSGHAFGLVLLLCQFLLAHPIAAWATEVQESPPINQRLLVEYGLASRHRSIGELKSLSSVVFVEDFEQSSIQELVARWDDHKNSNVMSFSSDKPSQSAGNQSVFFDGFADLYTRLLPGYDQLYIRYYIKFETECVRVHHGPWVGGNNPPLSFPFPRAGTRPNGDDRFFTGPETNNSTEFGMDFYTYWMHMRTNPGGRYFGNTFSGRPSPFVVPKGEWISVEFMVKMNDPVSSSNGEQAFWIDGVKKNHLGQGFPRGIWTWDNFTPDNSCTLSGPCDMNGSGTPCCTDFEGFRWRSTADLNLNYFWLEHFVDTDPSCGAYFDDLVIATEYIGPLGGEVFSDGFEG